MSLIVETGTASATSEAYASVAFCDAYHSAIGNIAWAALSAPAKEEALRRAAMFMSQSYRMLWKGTRVNAAQALDWPRHDVQLSDLGFANNVDSAEIPVLVQRANAELALTASTTPLNPNRTQKVASKQVGPIKIVYDESSPAGSKYVAVNDMLRPLLQSSGGVMVALRRC